MWQPTQHEIFNNKKCTQKMHKKNSQKNFQQNKIFNKRKVLFETRAFNKLTNCTSLSLYLLN